MAFYASVTQGQNTGLKYVSLFAQIPNTKKLNVDPVLVHMIFRQKEGGVHI